ncbi:hypothetical protein IZY60_14275 [Lutibacter sp. B2]|nr:hypothetical protein [Lutibacter sp. B2]
MRYKAEFKNALKQYGKPCNACLNKENCFNIGWNTCEDYRPGPTYTIPDYWPKEMYFRH